VSDQPPSLLICCFDVLPGHSGLSRRVTEYLKGIGDKYQVVVLSNKTPDHSHIERYQGARLLRVPIGSGDLQSRIQAFDRAVRRQLESEEYQIVHFFDPFGGYALCEGREVPQYRLIYDAQTFPSQELRYTHPHTEGDRRFLSKIRRQELFCLMNSDAVITGSEVTRRFILDQGVPESQVRVLRGPVELGLYTPEVLGRPDASPMKVLYLGSQLGYQGLPTLLRAMQLTVRQVDVRLTIVGPRHSEWQAHLSDLVNELKLAGKVEFQPPVGQDDLHKIVATCDLGALPLDDNERNRSQGGPMAKLGEYLAGGRPVIAADLPITRELVPEAAGVFFPCGDFKKLAEQLIDLAQNPARRVEMGQAARAAAEKVDASWIRGQLLDLYAEVAGRARNAAGGAESAAEITRAGKAPAPREESSKRRTPKTDPAIRADPSTDPEARDVLDRPAILGTPLREDEKEDQPRTQQVAGDLPEPVVMGTPLSADPEPTPRELPSLETMTPRPAPAPGAPKKGATPARGSVPSSPGRPAVEAAPDVTPIAPPPAPFEQRLTPSRGHPPLARAETPSGRFPSAERHPGSPSAETPSGRHPPIDRQPGPPLLTETPSGRHPPVDKPPSPPLLTETPSGRHRPIDKQPTSPRADSPSGRVPGVERQLTPARGLPAAAAVASRRSPGLPEVTPVHDPPPEPTPIRRPGALLRSAAAAASSANPALAESHHDLPPITRASGASHLPAVRSVPLPPPVAAEHQDEVSDEEVEEIADDEVLSADPAAATGDEDPVDSGDESAEVLDADDVEAQAIESDETPLPSRLDPWLAQLVHGYCPPDAPAFNRHTPPTNFPGRD